MKIVRKKLYKKTMSDWIFVKEKNWFQIKSISEKFQV